MRNLYYHPQPSFPVRFEKITGGIVNSSNVIVKLAVALSKAQAEMPRVKFDAKNPFIKNNYATLGAVIDASRPILAKNGLSLSQFPVSQEGRIGIRSVLMHESGEFIEDTITLVPETSKGLSINQTAGVTITYLRRYAWVSILGMYAEEDTDGNDEGSQGSASANAKVTEVMSRKWTPQQTEAVSIVILDAGLEPVTAEEASGILDLSVLSVDAPVKTIQSWTKHYMKSEGDVLAKSASANQAYMAAKKK
jgi:ERF superfamily protein